MGCAARQIAEGGRAHTRLIDNQGHAGAVIYDVPGACVPRTEASAAHLDLLVKTDLDIGACRSLRVRTHAMVRKLPSAWPSRTPARMCSDVAYLG